MPSADTGTLDGAARAQGPTAAVGSHAENGEADHRHAGTERPQTEDIQAEDTAVQDPVEDESWTEQSGAGEPVVEESAVEETMEEEIAEEDSAAEEAAEAESVEESFDEEESPTEPNSANESDSEESGVVEVEEEHQPLSFQIPAAQFKSALISSPSSAGAYWRYNLYRSAEGKAVRIMLCRKAEQVAGVVAMFADEPVLGFDMEWESHARLGSDSIKDNVSLIQIACEDKIALFQIAAFRGSTVEELMPQPLRDLLESPNVIKAGVNIGGDFSRLRKCFDIQGQGIFELSHLYKIVKFSEKRPHLVNRMPFKLAEQVHDILFLPLAKGAVRVSAWSRMLSAEQVEYAATDAYAGYRLFDALEARRKLMKPKPPRPALYELQQPLILGNGRVAMGKAGLARMAKSAPRQKASGSVISKASKVDAGDMQTNTAGHASMPDTEQQVEGVESEAQENDADDDEAQQQDDATDERCVAADEWVIKVQEEWTQSSTSRGRKPATRSSLRAYHLWHHQSLSVSEVAKLLRQPPLKGVTVANYIFSAISSMRLPYEEDRLRDVAPMLARFNLGGFRRVLDSL